MADELEVPDPTLVVDSETPDPTLVVDSEKPAAELDTDKASTLDPESLQKELKKKNSEAENLRKRLKELEAKEEAARIAKLSEVDQLKEQLKALKAEANEAQLAVKKASEEKAIDKALRAAAKDQGVPYELAQELVAAKAVVGEDGEVTGVTEALAEMVKKFPNLKAVSRASASGSITNPGTSQGKNNLSLDAIKNMTPKEINANWEQVSKVLSAKK